MCPPPYIPFLTLYGCVWHEGYSFAEVLPYQIIPSAPNTRHDELTSNRVYRHRGISHLTYPHSPGYSENIY